MADTTAIEWCDSTFNPWIGCTKVSPGCDHCYAEADFDKRRHVVVWGAGQARHRTARLTWRKPLQWQANAAAFQAQHGRRQRVFCASLADVLDNEVPAAWRMDLFKLIADTPDLDWLLLTKRIGNVMAMCSGDSLMFDLICSRVWLGATITSQAEADRDVPKLLQVPAHKRFLSIEPLLGPVNLEKPRPGPDLDQGGGAMICQPWLIQSGINWVIVGGESGPKARPMHPDWARSLRDQCAAAGVPFLFKQWGEFMPPESPGTKYPAKDWRDVVDTSGQTRSVHFVGDAVLESKRQVVRVGKKAAGRLLDGRTHDEVPTP